MPSFQITLSPKRRAASRFIGQVRQQLQRALAQAHQDSGETQSSVARKLDVNRSVVSRELKGHQDIGLGRIGEFAWALGLEPHFELRSPEMRQGQNIDIPAKSAPPPEIIGL